MPKRPWNIIDTPVYSLATQLGGVGNMNICTYVTAVSMQPKRFMVAIYQNTQTLVNMQKTEECVLQFLAQPQYGIVNALGKKSGKNYDKLKYLDKKQMLVKWQDFDVVQNAVAYIHLKKLNVMSAGDHDMYLFDVLKYKTNNDQALLTLQYLIEKKIILG